MSENILEVRHLKKYFPTKRGLLHAVDDVNFSIKKGTTMGLVGESGCGKSTVGRLILRLTEATDGEILFYDDDIRKYDREKMRHTRRRLQIVFQDPYASLDGRKSIFVSAADCRPDAGAFLKFLANPFTDDNIRIYCHPQR